jgi:molybdopterin synthase catalytic subunit
MHNDEIILQRLIARLKSSAERIERMKKKLPFWAKEMYNIAR